MARAKAKSKTLKGKTREIRHLVVVLKSPNGIPRRRAEIAARGAFRLKHLSAHRDCGQWELVPGSVLRVLNGETDAK